MRNYYLTKIKQDFVDNSLPDIKAELHKEIVKLRPLIKPNGRIALSVGSRGINNLALIVKEVAEFVRANNAVPFIIPAMGSHGNATAEGQAAILASYGITEETIGAPVKSSMEVVLLPQGESPVPVYMDKNAFESDGIILINRIKPHTDFHGKYESGLIKMSVIGLGKEEQASVIHGYGVHGLTAFMPVAAKQIFKAGRILGGVAIVENACDKTMLLKALRTDEFFGQEPVLLEIARQNMPSLPVKDIDVLIIDQMGKDFSGIGIDPNIIGRMKIPGQKEPEGPVIRAILLLDLSDGSHGNAIGIGLSDVITKRLYDKIDFPSTYKNIVTSSFIERAKIPITGKNDREAFEIALRSCGHLEKGKEKIVRIKNTLHLDELYLSQPLMELMGDLDRISVLEENTGLFADDTEITQF